MYGRLFFITYFVFTFVQIAAQSAFLLHILPVFFQKSPCDISFFVTFKGILSNPAFYFNFFLSILHVFVDMVLPDRYNTLMEFIFSL